MCHLEISLYYISINLSPPLSSPPPPLPLQITEALTFLHCSCRYIHRNICPSSVYVSKSGTWKLAGLEFIGESHNNS